MVSPMRSEDSLQPLSASTMGLSTSTAHSTGSGFPGTLNITCTYGLAQSTCVTVPVSVSGFVRSNFAASVCCAGADTAASNRARLAAARTNNCLIVVVPFGWHPIKGCPALSALRLLRVVDELQVLAVVFRIRGISGLELDFRLRR